MKQVHKRKKGKRLWIQIFAACLTNGYIVGFLESKIYKGSTKYFCVPGLNCYSCPGAVGSCPIGALQAVLGDRKYQFSYYVFGFLILAGALFGRLVCGILCPFGLVQDLLYKIPLRKIKIASGIDRRLRWLKYMVFLIFVILLPLAATNAFGMGNPYFCKWICPAGTLEGGIPLLLAHDSLRQSLGWLFNWKMFVLAIVIAGSVVVYRPFCKYLCPLGAFYSFFNRISVFQMVVDQEKCTNCRCCEKQCKMGVSITKNINSAECIRCGECIRACRQNAISMGFYCAGKNTAESSKQDLFREK